MNSYTNIETPIRIEERGDINVVHFHGFIGLQSVIQLRVVLAEQLELKRRVYLELKDVEGIDLCGLQLLCSAHRTFCTAGSRFEMSALPDAARQFARSAGYDVCTSECKFRDETCLWIN